MKYAMKPLPLRLIQLLLLSGTLASLSPSIAAEAPAKGWDVVLISCDDLNDWVGPLGAHPQARTPHLDRLAAMGMTFTRAQANATICCPSRSSMLTGLAPTTIGVYDNTTLFRETPGFKDVVTLPQAFRRSGYEAVASGKIFHSLRGPFGDEVSWNDILAQSFGTPSPPADAMPLSGVHWPANMPVQRKSHDWGPIDSEKEATGDFENFVRAAERLQKSRKQPLFLAAGTYRPHVPIYAPREFFERLPLAEVQVPQRPENDLDDLPAFARSTYINNAVMDPIKKANAMPKAVRAYLAATTYADDCVGRIVDAVEKSPNREKTILIFWSDHGFHLGEKAVWTKNTLWEESTRIPLIIVAPGLVQPGSRCDRVVSLLDLYPTLAELCGFDVPHKLEGRSLVPLLRDPKLEWNHPAVTANYRAGVLSYAVHQGNYHAIFYADGSRELYDLEADPDELTNLAADARHAARLEDMRRALPAKDRVVSPPQARKGKNRDE
jgi:arylsulfatase A-like enzyme